MICLDTRSNKPVPSSVAVPEMKSIIADNNSFLLTVTGLSMQPLLKDRTDSVVISPVKKKLKRGDIILAEDENSRCILHRIRFIGNGRIRLNGDYSMTEEDIPEKNVIGIAFYRVRNGKYRKLSRLYGIFWLFLRPLRPFMKKHNII